ncbi:MAG TPA: riboflavin synthase [Casimicrobiaceae bacterium]|nr:riboflavin synthase [Casimicrobiaceae bacterium]
MFTGIVQAVGRIAEAGRGPSAVRLLVDPQGLDVGDVAIGDSIAINGCCLTVVALEAREGRTMLAFDVSAETLRCTAGLDASGPVNLEKALRLADRLGGHLMTGHVDGLGTVVALEPVAEGGGWGSHRLVVDAPPGLARFIAAKGSVAVQGVSLTVNAVAGTRFEVNLIPHTLDATTLRALRAGDRVNLEIDLVARYVARLAEFDG